jgi:hypothetical protein
MMSGKNTSLKVAHSCLALLTEVAGEGEFRRKMFNIFEKYYALRLRPGHKLVEHRRRRFAQAASKGAMVSPSIPSCMW